LGIKNAREGIPRFLKIQKIKISGAIPIKIIIFKQFRKFLKEKQSIAL